VLPRPAGRKDPADRHLSALTPFLLAQVS
jgi:hypothetical protein